MKPYLLALLTAGCTLAHPSPSFTYDDAESSQTFDTSPIRHDILGPIPTLLPVVHALHDGRHYDHFVPKQPGHGASLHYAEEDDFAGHSGGAYAIVTPNFKLHSIVLDHIYHIDEVSVASNGDLRINFGHVNAFEHGRRQWSSPEQLVFVTYTPGCGDFHRKDRCYFLAETIVFDEDTFTVIVIGGAADLGDVTHDVQLSWGSYKEDVSSSLHKRQQYNNVTLPVWPGPGDTRNEKIGHVAPTCTPPVDNKYGLPTACQGTYFDDDLDSQLGYKDAEDFAWGSFAIDTLLESVGNETTLSPGMRKRFIKIPNPIAAIKKKVQEFKQSIKELPNKVVTVVKTVGAVVSKVAEFGKNIITGQPTTAEYEFTKLLLPQKADSAECKKTPDSCKPTGAKAVKSPWDGDAILIKSFGTAPQEEDIAKLRQGGRQTLKHQFLNIYCVNCGLSGSAKLKGNVTIKIGQGVTDGSLSLEADLKVGVGIGVYAQMYRQETFNHALFKVPLSPFTIGIATIGPWLTIGARAVLTANITGLALARADVKLAKSSYVWDFKAGKTKESNFKPEFDPSFEVNGNIALSAEFGIPVSLDFGIDTFATCQKCSAKIFVETYPYIRASAEMSAEANWSKVDGAKYNFKAIDGCKGISTRIDVGNKVSVGFNGFGFVQNSALIHETEPRVLKSWCLGKKNNTKTAKRDDKFLTLDAPVEKRQSTGEAQNSTAVAELTPWVVSDREYTSEHKENAFLNSYIITDNGEDGYWYTTIEVASFGHNGAVFAACDDGNVYIMTNETIRALPAWISCSYLWGGYDGTIFGPPNGGVLHYYRDEVNRTGVSRLRVSDLDEVPSTAVMLNLVALGDDDPTTNDYVMGVDLDSNLFYPVVCTYRGSSNAKIFVVSDPVAGLTTLQSPDVKYSITNGDVDRCTVLPLIWGAKAGGEGEWAEYNDALADAFAEYFVEVAYAEAQFDELGKWIDALPPGWEDSNVLPKGFFCDTTGEDC
ncbi:hypothetical protein FB567DRAFT_574941 [Paraphoma chrysanthemicola]|uniref:Uncharacterized protein n=1 Tax=Paraphoma chrysanthemicola TaxID=798071 RepID=A0A8K0RGU7_9PLEO|nr:hypothetical protein FB567DRAFT_574941 [Paraphoma chrysanthemicola]